VFIEVDLLLSVAEGVQKENRTQKKHFLNTLLLFQTKHILTHFPFKD